MLFQILGDRVVQGILIATTALIAIGWVFYRLVEGWGWLDSLYFSVVTLTTVGYGDLAPESAAAKLFTVFYILGGVGLFAAAGTAIIQRSRFWVRLEEPGQERDGEHKP